MWFKFNLIYLSPKKCGRASRIRTQDRDINHISSRPYLARVAVASSIEMRHDGLRTAAIGV